MPFSPENARALGALIQSKIAEKGLRIKAVSEKIGISRTYFAGLRRGRAYSTPPRQLAQPSIDVLRKLDAVLGIGEEAYRLAGYSRDEYSAKPPAYHWGELLEWYVGELKQTFQSVDEGRRGKMLEDVSKIVKRYKPEVTS